MPCRSNADLPSSVRDHLPAHAEDIYREAFNHPFAAYAGDTRREEIAYRTAWAAVKKSYYVKLDDHWVRIEGTACHQPQTLNGSRCRQI
nr:ChaB family protein [Bradyrhizobium sp. LMTR 3]